MNAQALSRSPATRSALWFLFLPSVPHVPATGSGSPEVDLPPLFSCCIPFLLSFSLSLLSSSARPVRPAALVEIFPHVKKDIPGRCVERRTGKGNGERGKGKEKGVREGKGERTRRGYPVDKSWLPPSPYPSLFNPTSPPPLPPHPPRG